jgi:hypothetical protein
MRTLYSHHGLVFSLSLSLATAFAYSSPPLLHPPSNLHTVTDPATLVTGESARVRHPRRWSSTKHEQKVDDLDHQASDRIELNELNIEKLLQAEEARVRFQGLTTTNKQASRRKQTIKRSKSRSSTMPGYSIPSNNQQAHAKSLTWLEDQTGDDMSALQTLAVQRKRKSASGDAMYQASSSVPDSLMQFAKELHQVRTLCLLCPF